MKNLNLKHFLTMALLLMMGGGVYSVTHAENIPTQFWRVVQRSVDMFFEYGNLNNPVAKVMMGDDGSMVFDDTGSSALGQLGPANSALLELRSTNKAVLVTRVANQNSIRHPLNGMIVYVNNLDCFKVFQGGDWSQCVGTAYSLEAKDELPNNAGENGDIYFNMTKNVLEVHNGVDWIKISQKLVTVGIDYPPSPLEREIFYNRETRQFFVYHGGQWVEISTNFNNLVAVQTDCERVPYRATQGKEIACPNNKFVTEVEFEEKSWTDAIDNLANPEVRALKCCSITYEPAP